MAGLPLLQCPRCAAGEWGDAVEFRDVETGAAPEQGTTVRAAWDADELRVLVHAQDRDPWATITQRDGPLWEEEVVELFLDPVGDGECYFEFEVNPLGTVLDLVLRRNRSGYAKNFAWNCDGLRTVVTKSAGAWTAEFGIPFRSLVAEPPQPGARWRANFCRIDRPPGRERELSAWSPTGGRSFHVPERFGVLEFV